MEDRIPTREYPTVKMRTRMDGPQMGVASRMAFPATGTTHATGGPGQPWQEGMTIRTYLAGQAIAGFAANKNFVRVGDFDELRKIAEMAVAVADYVVASSEIEVDGEAGGVL